MHLPVPLPALSSNQIVKDKGNRLVFHGSEMHHASNISNPSPFLALLALAHRCNVNRNSRRVASPPPQPFNCFPISPLALPRPPPSVLLTLLSLTAEIRRHPSPTQAWSRSAARQSRTFAAIVFRSRATPKKKTATRLFNATHCHSHSALTSCQLSS